MTPTRLSRRAVLTTAAALAVGAVAGCDAGDPTPPSRDDTVRDRLASGARRLVNDHTETLRRHPDLEARLTPLVAEHEAHLAALGRSLTTTPSASPAPTPTVPSARGDALAALTRAEREASDEALTLVSGTSPSLAALAASVSGCRAAHAELLAPGSAS